MAESSTKISKIHVWIPPEFERALKIFCVRGGTTGQAWISELIETKLKTKAPELWSKNFSPKRGKLINLIGEDPFQIMGELP